MQRGDARELIARLENDAARIAARFELSYRAIRAENPSVRARYGVCFADGLIKIRLHHASSGRALKYSSLVNTLCHELAHLRHFDHGPRFKAFYFRLLDYARSEGIYRPGAPATRELVVAPSRAPTSQSPRRAAAPPAAPEQLALFSGLSRS